MARVCFLVLMAGLQLQLYGLGAEVTDEITGPVFASPQTANTMLHRQRRYNSGHLEEILYKANLERECKEETCSMEEAREVFENDEKTMEFWAGYIDGDQCNPRPCQNGGVCQDGVGTYVCWCKPNFSGKNCEIELTKQCLVNNGGCGQFCVMQGQRPLCRCTGGYTLGSDKKSCEPTGEFSCGQVSLSSSFVPRSFTPQQSSNTEISSKTNQDHNRTQQDDYYYDNITLSYDYSDISTNESDPLNLSVDYAINVRSMMSDPPSSVSSADAVSVDAEAGTDKTPTEKKPLWAFPTLPTIKAQGNVDQRIVGGDVALPGEIPWQVSLMSRSDSNSRAETFCGGSLLSDLWVITAAHCLMEAEIKKINFFIRAGEHDINVDEGPERDHVVAEKYIYPFYDYQTSPYNHDIALLKLAQPVELSNERRPICLGPKEFTQNLLRESTSSLVSGWGRLKFLGPEATKLQKLAVPHVDRTMCKQSSQDHITRYMFCAGFENEQKDSCQGDSGGPHATKYKGTWFLTGIVSWGEECAKEGKYGIYTRVSRYYQWISQKMGLRMTS
ncbi:coagulation factor IX-like [Xenentodon cancila]